MSAYVLVTLSSLINTLAIWGALSGLYTILPKPLSEKSRLALLFVGAGTFFGTLMFSLFVSGLLNNHNLLRW